MTGDGPVSAEARSSLVAAWVREVAGLPAEAPVLVQERAVARSGWPPHEVVIVYGTAHGRHERVIAKRLARVTRLDVVGAWRDADPCCGA